jgi:hypothetical protein
MDAVWVVLALSGIGVAAWLVLEDLRPPRPARPPRLPRPKPPVSRTPVPVEAPAVLPRPVAQDVPAQTSSAAVRRASILDVLEVEHDTPPPTWRRASSAAALLVMTLVVAALTGAGIYRGLLAFKG